MDFIVGLPHTSRGFDSNWVIVDWLTNFEYFLPIRSAFSANRLAHIYIYGIIRLHEVQVSIISY